MIGVRTRRALHEALDLVLDALEADARGVAPAAPAPPRRSRRLRTPPPLPDPSTVKPEDREFVRSRM